VSVLEHNSPVIGTSRPTSARTDHASRVCYQVGGISFAMQAQPGMRLALDPGLADFAFKSPLCDLEFACGWTSNLTLPRSKPAFVSGGLWTAYRENNGTSLYFQTPRLGETPYKHCWLSDDLSHGRVSLLQRFFDPELPVYPLEYPLDELLMIHRLSRGDGVEIHSCGVVSRDGAGRLFVGHSGAGKSTASRLWLREPGIRVLSDDRIIVRMEQGGPVMYGTPWHGDAGLAEPSSASLQRIFLLEQAAKNEIVPLAPARGAAELFARTFVPHHHAEGVARTLQFLEKLTSIAPVSILRCTADARAIEEVLRAA